LEDVPVKRGRGRPPGSKNKRPEPVETKLTQQIPRVMKPFEGYEADPDRVIAKQITMLAWQQDALQNEMKAQFTAGKFADPEIIEKLSGLSNGIVRTIDALKKYDHLADELRRRMTPAETLEKAIVMLEGQDTATLNAIIRRLRAKRAAMAPVDGVDKLMLGEPSGDKSAVEMMQELG
jgi:hypothetical protein